MTSKEERDLYEQIGNLYEVDPEQRRLFTLANILCRNLADHLRKWVEGGQYGPLFDNVEDNLNPVGRVFYSASTLVCTPASRSQEVGLALGAQAGEARMRDVVLSGGFTQFRRASQTPFNLVFEARA